jgi:hypothetical protein
VGEECSSGDRSCALAFVRRESKVEPRIVLKFKAALLAIALPANTYERRHKTDHFEVSAQFHGVPDRTVLGFKGFPSAGLDARAD